MSTGMPGLSWPPAWMDDALCTQSDPEAWFPGKGESPRLAKLVCSGCPVRSECLSYALAHRERFGVWGGLTERERRPMLTARSHPAAA
jgi:WhiB family transcriptional regulator, redox-sensing transcriptional regulator